MRIPLAWLAEMVELPPGVTAAQVASTLVRVGLEEESLDVGEVTGPVVVGRVLTVQPEPQKNGKTISWCTVEVGSALAATDGGPRGIVCGASNFGPGDLVVVSLPGAVLSGGFAIAARKTYGHVSDGMICSARELGLGDDHEGIIVLGSLGLHAQPGDDAIAMLGLDEQTLEVNVTPDRGYCLSIRGIAREYRHATGATGSFADPASVQVPASHVGAYPVVVHDDAPIHGNPGCDRFVRRTVRGIDPGAPSPFWMRRRLQQAGMRPISLAVDVTNYVMLAVGQPLHAYDLGTLDAAGITVRRARQDEKLTTLDGVVRELHPQDLLISDGPDGERAIGMAGVMGGARTEVGPGTTDVLLEAAHFDPVSVARTARRHRLPSEASKRFERGVDPGVAPAAAELAVRLLVEHGGGTADPAVGDLDATTPPAAIGLPADLPTRLVGVHYPLETVLRRLTEIGCHVTVSGSAGEEQLSVTPPSWRPDLGVGADLVEEVARLEGYAHIPSVLPVAPPGRGLDRSQRARRAAARTLAEAGWTEVLSYPFVPASVHDAFGLDAQDPRRTMVRLANPLSDEAPFLRTSVLSTLVDVLRRNVSRGAVDVAVYEIGSVTRPARQPAPGQAPRLGVDSRPEDDELARLVAAVPPQPVRVAGLATGRREPAGWWGAGRSTEFSDAIEAALLVGRGVGVDVAVSSDVHAPWHPGRCAALHLPDGTLVGHAGELHPRVCEVLDLPARTIAFEIDLDVLVASVGQAVRARPISAHPVVKEDVALIVDAAVPAVHVQAALREGGGELLEEVRLFDVYTGHQVGEGKKSLAFALRMRARDRTLTAQESAAVRHGAVAAAVERFAAILRAG